MRRMLTTARLPASEPNCGFLGLRNGDPASNQDAGLQGGEGFVYRAAAYSNIPFYLADVTDGRAAYPALWANR